ncbi:hypothetical protein [Streptomyces hydrogenans]|uniref:hypothetical protein n=1 Tax=Streptomyces hydrogenans TaxID=1873719 RepID=UPI00167CB5F9|nr:hypothetical protein [Streptomyces hydrogenans]GHG45385.1 hypothetical protein GCM10018784_69120 [Streptomyces hydrogenans]
MDSSEGTARYLEEFRSEVVDGLRQELDARGACLRDLVFAESEEGVWATAVVGLPGEEAPWVRRRLIVPASGPDKDAWLAGAVFASAMVEELDAPSGPA